MLASITERVNAFEEIAWVPNHPVYRERTSKQDRHAERFRREFEQLVAMCRGDGPPPSRDDLQRQVLTVFLLATGPFAPFQRSLRHALFQLEPN